jgi:hypothetical protein
MLAIWVCRGLIPFFRDKGLQGLVTLFLRQVGAGVRVCLMDALFGLEEVDSVGWQ